MTKLQNILLVSQIEKDAQKRFEIHIASHILPLKNETSFLEMKNILLSLVKFCNYIFSTRCFHKLHYMCTKF